MYSDQELPNTAPKDTSKQPRHASSRPACHQDQMTPQGLWAAVFTSRMQSTLFLEYQEWQFFMLIKKKKNQLKTPCHGVATAPRSSLVNICDMPPKKQAGWAPGIWHRSLEQFSDSQVFRTLKLLSYKVRKSVTCTWQIKIGDSLSPPPHIPKDLLCTASRQEG